MIFLGFILEIPGERKISRALDVSGRGCNASNGLTLALTMALWLTP